MATTREERRRARIDEQRRARRRQRRTGVGRVPLIAMSAIVLVGAVGLGIARRDSSDGGPKLASLTRTGSTVVPAAPEVVIERTPPAYRIVYRVENRGKQIGYRTETVTVRRPWDSRLDSLRGRPPGGEALSTEVLTLGKRRTTAPGQPPEIFDLPPAVPVADVRLAPALAPGLAAGALVKREVREVAGRRCQVYRSAGYLSSSALDPPAADGYADSCVDAAGLLLEEVLVDGGEPIARRVAVQVDEHPELTDALFPAGARTVEPTAGGGVTRPLTDGSMPPGDFLILDTPPEGFVHRGRYSVVPPQAENFDDNNPGGADARRAEIADVYERGLDVLVVTQGGTLRGGAPFELTPGRTRIDLGRFGQGEVDVSAVGNQVRAVLDGGHYLVVSGTLDPEELAGVARSLRTVPGSGTLQYADES